MIERKTACPVIAGFVAAALCASSASAATIVTPAPLTKTEKNIETAGSAVAVALPLFAGGVALYKGDWTGAAMLTADTVASVGTAYALKSIVRERRPDGSDYRSFPSDTSALASSGSSFLWGRYGWEWGLPAFAASQFVSYSRVQAKKHHWYDTIAGSAISISYAAIFTQRYHRNRNIYSDLDVSPDGAELRVGFRF